MSRMTLFDQAVDAALDKFTDTTGLEDLVVRLLEESGRRVESRGGSRDAGIDLIIREGRSKGVTRLGQVSAEQDVRAKVRKWLARIRRTRPDTRLLAFITPLRVSSELKESLCAMARKPPKKDLEVCDRAWFRRNLRRHPELAREFLGIESETLAGFIDGEEYARILGERSISRRVGQLPPFVGRKEDIDRLAVLLPCSDIVVITGAGGIGKSRFVFEASASAGIRAALPERAWRFVRPDTTITDSSLASLPAHGKLVLVLDDPHQDPGSSSLRHLRRLKDSSTGGRDIRLILTTRPSRRDEVIGMLAPRVGLNINSLDLGPLPRASMNELLELPPLGIRAEPTRVAILEMARGIPAIAEAAAVLVRKGGKLEALKDATWQLIESELDPESLSRLGISLPSARKFIGIVAAFPVFPGSDPAVRAELQQLTDLGHAGLDALTEHLVRSGFLQDLEGGRLTLKPDVLAESAVSHLFFEDASQLEYNELVWKPFRKAPAHTEADSSRGEIRWASPPHEASLLARLGELHGAAQLRRFLDDELADRPDRVRSADNCVRRALVEQFRPLARVSPGLFLQIAGQVIRHPSPDFTDHLYGFLLEHTRETVIDEVVAGLRVVISAGSLGELEFEEALDLLLQACVATPGHGVEGVHGRGLHGDRKASRLIAELVHVEWSWTPGRDLDFQRSSAILKRLDAWFQMDPPRRGRLLAAWLERAVKTEFTHLHPSAAEKTRFVLHRATFGFKSTYLRDVADTWLKLSERGDPPARFAAIDVLERLFRAIRDALEAVGPDDPTHDVLSDTRGRLFAWLDENHERYSTPARFRLLHVLARAAATATEAEPLVARLTGDARLGSYAHLVGAGSLPEPETDVDYERSAALHQEWVRSTSARLANDQQAMVEFLEMVNSLKTEAEEAFAMPLQQVPTVLFEASAISPQAAMGLITELRTRFQSLGSFLTAPLCALWRSSSDEAASLCSTLLLDSRPLFRASAARSLALAQPTREALDLAFGVAAAKGADAEPGRSALLHELRWHRRDGDPAWAGVLLNAGMSGELATVPDFVRLVGPRGQHRRRLRPQFEVTDESLPAYDNLLHRLLELARIPDDDDLTTALEEWAARAPESFLSAVQDRQDLARVDSSIEAMPEQIQAALHALKRGEVRDSFIRRTLEAFRSAEHTRIESSIIQELLDARECDVVVRTELASAAPNLRVLEACLPGVSVKEDFFALIPSLLERLPRDTWPMILSAWERSQGLIGQVYSGPQLPAWNGAAEEFAVLQGATDSLVRSFGSWASQSLRDVGKRLHGYELSEYDLR